MVGACRVTGKVRLPVACIGGGIKELNPMIFNWLDVLDINVVVILALMLSVAGFTMILSLIHI